MHKMSVTTTLALQHLYPSNSILKFFKRPNFRTIVESYDPTTQHFMPLAMELSGRWGPSAQQLFSLVSERARDLKGVGVPFTPLTLALDRF